jgi:lipopolysaccharide/colanic/teichoic acid biosynthesis glycosyltransferase
MKRPVATEQAPPAQPPKPASRLRRDDLDSARLGDIRSTTPYRPVQGAIRRSASVVALVVLDLVGLVLGVYAALTVRAFVYGDEVSQWGLRWKVETDWLPFLTVITVLVFWRAGLYTERERRAGFGRILASLALVAVITLIFAVGTGHEFGTYGLAPTAVLLSSAFIGLLRGSYDVITGDLLKFAGVRRRAILVGAGESLARLHRALGASRGGIDYDFIGAISTSGDSAGLRLLGDVASLPAVLATHRRGVKVRVAPRASELLIERRGEYVPGQGVPLFELRPPVFVGADWVVKRGFDLGVSIVVAVLGFPIWLLIALAIKLDSRGPILYRDRRVGLNETEFDMLKFRTMRADAEEHQAELERSNEADGALFKIKDDPRVTRVGDVLRRFSLDEVPQVLNVLRGEMSLVGPRPLPVRDYELLEPWHRKRYLVLPGMTGLWQIAGRSSLGFDDLVRLDFYYLEHWSIWLDISILLKTVPAVLGSRGAY